MINNKQYLPNIPGVKLIPDGVAAPQGFTASAVYCGIKRAGYPDNTVTAAAILANESIQAGHKPDIALIACDTVCEAAAVYTRNLVQAAPITVCREHLANGRAQAIIVNSGNANACTADGLDKARVMCRMAAQSLGIAESDVLAASTGVIGQVLPIGPIEAAAPALAGGLSKDGTSAARAIMTTDTVEKQIAAEFELGGKTVRLGAMSKGSGMIHPNMGTMLCFVTTDAAVSSEMLHSMLHEAADDSFNMLSVDGDTSTNDTLAILASGKAGNPCITAKDADYVKFSGILREICLSLARLMARDGEGATKLVECRVTGAKDEKSARAAAKAVICSPLLKSAMFGCDANWGRILCAVGYSGAQADVTDIGVAFSSGAGRVEVCERGSGIPFSETDAKTVLSDENIIIEVTMRDGAASAAAFGCDLTYDYVKINGDYRT